jgi:sugar lactone lactonase YvrE
VAGQLRPVSTDVAELGEGARWDAGAGELLWVDIMAGVLRRAVEDGDGLRTVAAYDIGEPLGAAAPLGGGDGWLLAAARGFRRLAPDGTVTALVDTEPADVRMNDAACDPQGRFWAGSMAYDERAGAGRLLRCEPDGSVRVMLARADIANGLGWSPDGSTLYHCDSGTATVTAYEPETMAGRVLIRPERGAPDGMTVDDEGCLWVALHGAGEVRRYDPDGNTLSVWPLPVSQPTSVAIGGASGRRLFVTTAWENLDEGQRAGQPEAGRVFAADDAGVGAPPVRPYRGTLPARFSG